MKMQRRFFAGFFLIGAVEDGLGCVGTGAGVYWSLFSDPGEPKGETT